MTTYVESNLINNESIEYLGHASLWSLFPKILAGFLLLPASGIGMVFFFMAAVTYFTTELAVTNKRVIAKYGFIRRKTVELSIRNVESVQVKQGYVGRVFNYGTVIVSGAGNPQTKIVGVSDPLAFKREYYASEESLGR